MIYFDEAGNSGANLLDINQPVYLLLSHNFNVEETEEIIRPLKLISNADELHFKNIKKYASPRKALIECLNNKLIQPDRVCYYVAHKKYMIALQMVDQLIEPVMYDFGTDIYQYGVNISTGNMLHIMGTVLWNKELYDEICHLFVRWMRSASHEDCKLFYKSIHNLRVKTSKEDGQLLDLIMLSQRNLDTIVPALNKYTLDVTLSCFNAHCQFWADIYKNPFNVIFDRSKQIEYWTDMIDFLTNALPEGEVGFGSKKYKYPLLINKLEMDDSYNNDQLQLADILASSLNHLFINWSKGEADDFCNEIDKSLLHINAVEKKMWPSSKVTPEDLSMTDGSGKNPLDFIAEAAARDIEKYNKAFRK